MCNVGMCLRLKKQGAIFKFDNGTVVRIKKTGDRYEIKKRKEKENEKKISVRSCCNGEK